MASLLTLLCGGAGFLFPVCRCVLIWLFFELSIALLKHPTRGCVCSLVHPKVTEAVTKLWYWIVSFLILIPLAWGFAHKVKKKRQHGRGKNTIKMTAHLWGTVDIICRLNASIGTNYHKHRVSLGKQWCTFHCCIQFRPTPHPGFFCLNATRTQSNRLQCTEKKASLQWVQDNWLRTIAGMFCDGEGVNNVL